MELKHGRPRPSADRTARELRTYDCLDRLGIRYDRIDHAPADTMELCRAIEHCLGAPICKNLLLCNRQGTAFYLLLMPGEKVFKTKELSAQIGSARLSFASPEKMQELLDILPGSLSVMGLINDHAHQVALLIDEDLLTDDFIGCHPCVNTSTLRIAKKDLFEVFLPSLGYSHRTVRLVGTE